MNNTNRFNEKLIYEKLYMWYVSGHVFVGLLSNFFVDHNKIYKIPLHIPSHSIHNTLPRYVNRYPCYFKYLEKGTEASTDFPGVYWRLIPKPEFKPKWSKLQKCYFFIIPISIDAVKLK